MPNQGSKSSESVSIIVVNWNGMRWLPRCLETLTDQTYKNFEIIMVDNASEDKSVAYIRSEFPNVRIVRNATNLGYARSVDIGIRAARGQLILLINNDMWVKRDFVEKFISSYRRSDADIVVPCLAGYDTYQEDQPPGYAFMDIFGHPITLKCHPGSDPLVLNSPCLLFAKKVYEQTGGMDTDMFMYFEDHDWFWRANLFGKKLATCEDCWAHHAIAGSTGSGLNYYQFLWRNQNKLTMLIKNYSTPVLVVVLPIYMVKNILEVICFVLIGRPRIAWTYVQGWSYNARNIKRILEKRRWVQSQRKRSDLFIMRKMYKGVGEIRHLVAYIKNRR